MKFGSYMHHASKDVFIELHICSGFKEDVENAQYEDRSIKL